MTIVMCQIKALWYAMLRIEISSIGSLIWMPDFSLVKLFGKVIEPLSGGDLPQEVHDQEQTLRVNTLVHFLFPSSSFCFLLVAEL